MRRTKISRKLETLFNLPPASALGHSESETQQEALDAAKADIEESKAVLIAADNAIDKIDAALPMVSDLDTSDAELDELADLAKSTFKDLVDLSLNVEPRFSGPIIQSASTLLGHAITAKMAKMDKKLKMVDLQLKKAKLDQTANQGSLDTAVEGKGTVVDRTELLRAVLAQTVKPNKDAK